jgi:hypothetical protein
MHIVSSYEGQPQMEDNLNISLNRKQDRISFVNGIVPYQSNKYQSQATKIV